MMKKYLFLVITFLALFSCKKEEINFPTTFPGFTGGTDRAIWVVYSHNISDTVFLKNYLISKNPTASPAVQAKMVTNFNASLVSSRRKEVSRFALRLNKSGDMDSCQIATKTWVKIPDYKWEDKVDYADLISSKTGTPVVFAQGFPDQEKLVVKYRKSFYGDVSADKEKIFMEIYYTKF